MKKVIIASFKDEAEQLLESLQQAGIMQVLDAQQAAISRDAPELQIAPARPRELEERLEKLEQVIGFLKNYTEKKPGIEAVLSPKPVVDQNQFTKIVSSQNAIKLFETCWNLQQKINHLKVEIENISAQIQHLEPWRKLTVPLEEFEKLQRSVVLTGFLSAKNLIEAEKKLAEQAIIQQVSKHNNTVACTVICLKDNMQEVIKALRSLEFEAVSFAGLKGTCSELISQNQQKLENLQNQLAETEREIKKLAREIIDLQILADYWRNMLNKKKTQLSSPQTEQVIIFEGWVKSADFEKLKQIVAQFSASSLNEVPISKDETVPVEIENKPLFKPFEMITRLYGMPQHIEFDPTVLLAPFFAVFFGLCLGDAGYGLIIIAAMAYFITKIQGDKKLLWLLLICSIFAVVAGMITGSWFGDAPQQLAQAFGWTFLIKIQQKLMLFDPLTQPMIFFQLALALGYIQIMTGLVAAMIHNISRRDYISAICDKLTWLIMLNSLVLMLFGEKIGLSKQVCSAFGKVAIAPAVIIVFFSQRQGSFLARIGMGLYNLFSTIFYMGDVLSYLRLMALGMVGSGMAMAINIMAKTAMRVPYAGIILAILILICGHLFNTLMSALGAFVHTIRLQFVEFFPKFLAGGGKPFEPLVKNYKYVYVNEEK